MKAISRVLVIKLGAIGEFVMSLPAMRRIREAHPHAEIVLLPSARFEQLARSSRYFNAVFADGEPDGVSGAMALVGWMRRSRFDRIYDLENSARTHLYFLALRPSPPQWSGTAPGCALPHLNPYRSRMHVLERQADQLQHAGIWPNAPVESGAAPPPDLSWITRRSPEIKPSLGATKPRPYTLMAPGGTSKAAKLWPIERFADLAGQLDSHGMDVVIIGGPEESGYARAIQRVAKRARDLTGRTDFAQIALLGARASLAVGNDSGATHLMAAAGAPTIALFSKASEPDLSGPRGYVAILRSGSLKDLPVQQVAETARVMTRLA